MPSEAETPVAACGPAPPAVTDPPPVVVDPPPVVVDPPPVVVDPPPVVVDRSEASEVRASLSEAETPVAACGPAEDPARADPSDPVALWLASDSARELDADLDEAFGHLQRGFEMLLSVGQDGELGALGPDRLISMAKRLEAHRTRLVLIDSHVIEAAAEERVHDHVCTSTKPLAQMLHISSGEAAARVARAAQLIAQNGFGSGTLAPSSPSSRPRSATGTA